MSDISLLQLVTILGNSGVSNSNVVAFLYWQSTTDQSSKTLDYYFVSIADYMSDSDAAAWRIEANADGIPVPNDDNNYNNVALLQPGRLNGASYMFDNGNSA